MTVAEAPAALPPGGRRLVVYTMHDERGGVEDFVLHALTALRPHADRLVVLADGSLDAAARRALEALADLVVVQRGVGTGLWAYRAGLRVVDAEIAEHDEVVLTGDQWFGPIGSFDGVFADMDRRKVDLWAMTDRWHPQSDTHGGSHGVTTSWIAARRRAVVSDAWRRYWRSLPRHQPSKHAAWRYEQDFAPFFAHRGFRVGAAFTEETFPSDDPAMFNAELLIEAGCPVVVRDVFDGYPLTLDQHAVIGRRIASAMSGAGYPVELLWRNLARTLAPKTLNTNAAMLEVLSESAPPRTADAVARVLVVVQIAAMDHVADTFARIDAVPGDVHVVAVIAAQELEDAVTQAWSAGPASSRSPLEVRVAPGRTGADTASVFAECRDLVESDAFDLVVALHTSVPRGLVRNAARYFRRQQLDSLLASRGHVENLLALFDAEPGLGLVFPPTPHIGMSTLGDGWRGLRPRAETVAKGLGIHVPFDWASPLAPVGGMWIGRPRALRRLAERTWPTSDGELVAVHSLLHAYAAGEGGFHTRTVSTAVHAGLSHGSLEYTLDHFSMTFYGYPAGYISLLHRAGPVGTGSARDFARMYLRYRRPRVAAGLKLLARPARGIRRLLATARRRGAGA